MWSLNFPFGRITKLFSSLPGYSLVHPLDFQLHSASLFNIPITNYFDALSLSLHVCVCVCVCVRAHARSVLSDSFVTPWTVAHQAPLFMGFSKQEYCSGLLSPAPGDLLHVGIKPAPPTSPALAGRFFIASAMGVKGG